MLLYRSAVMNALTDVIEPALRKTIDRALTSQYGAGWYYSVGKDVMKDYESYSEIESSVNEEVPAIDVMDIPALIYLLKPKKSDDDEEEFESAGGLMPDVANFFGWDDRAVLKILRIRFIRNKCYHDKFERRFQPSELNIKSGVQEKLWLNDLESALKLLDPSQDLTSYKDTLLEKILMEEKKNDGETNVKISLDPAVLSYIREVESVRSQYMKITRFAFSEAPVKEALSGPAPWSNAADDLSGLAWPSEELSAAKNGQNKNMNNPAQNAARSNSDTLNKAISSLDKGVSKLVNWLNKK